MIKMENKSKQSYLKRRYVIEKVVIPTIWISTFKVC